MIRLKAEWIEWDEDDDSGHHSHEMAGWWLAFIFDDENINKSNDEALAKWGGHYECDDGGTEYAVFDNEADAIAFLLRWG